MTLGNVLVGQSGGCTAVINASLAGVLDEALAHGAPAVYGMLNGVEGLLAGRLVDLGAQSFAFRALLRQTPSGILGSCRYKLAAGDIERLLDTVRRLDAHTFCYIGGNDSADTSHRLAQAAAQAGYELRVVAVPKTVDNDLPEMDHSPGYGSIARFLALAVRDAGRDTEAVSQVYPIKVFETQGRNAGWVPAATALAREHADDAPHLIGVPERPFDLDRFLDAVANTHARLGRCVIAVSENLRDPNGQPLDGGEPLFRDSFGHAYYEGAGSYLRRVIAQRLGLVVRVDKPGTLQRMSMITASPVDIDEAYAAGQAAIQAALRDEHDVIVTLLRESDEPYRCVTGLAPLTAIANTERKLPDDFLNAAGNDVTPAFLRYARPLIGGSLPPYARLELKTVPIP